MMEEGNLGKPLGQRGKPKLHFATRFSLLKCPQSSNILGKQEGAHLVVQL